MLVSQFGLHQRPWARLLDCWLWREYFVYVDRWFKRVASYESPDRSSTPRLKIVHFWGLVRWCS